MNKPIEDFTDKEIQILSHFFTNTDKNIFVLKNLPPEVSGALFSRYSRTQKSLRRLFLDEYVGEHKVAIEKFVKKGSTDLSDLVDRERARVFYEKWLAQYGDDSIAQMTGIHIAFEGASNVLIQTLEDARIGLAPLEKSTRYVFFDQKVNGKYLYFTDSDLKKAGLDKEYNRVMDLLFDSYSQSVQPLTEYLKKLYPLEEGQTDRAYSGMLRAKACDVLRYYLPASTKTNAGFFGNGQALEQMLQKLYASQLSEFQTMGKSAHEELNKIIPSLLKRPLTDTGRESQDYLNVLKDIGIKSAKKLKEKPKETRSRVDLVYYDKLAEEKIIAAIIYPHTHLSMEKVVMHVKSMSQEERSHSIKKYLGLRKKRYHKPGRAFENAYYLFDIVGNFGVYRDLHRHRMMTQQHQLYSTDYGYDVPEDLVKAKLDKPYHTAMKEAEKLYKKIAKTLSKEHAQYAVPMGYRVRWYQLQNLRQVLWETELRTGPQGHPDYRKIEQEKYNLVKKVHPNLVHNNFVDMNDYALARRESEMKIDKKLAEVEKKRK